MSTRHHAFLWTIESWPVVSKLPRGQFVSSNSFKFNKGNTPTGSLNLYPNGVDRDSSKNISVNVYISSVQSVTEGTVEISLMNDNKRKVLTRKRSNCLIEESQCIEFPNFIKKQKPREQVESLLKNDKITILCEITLKNLVTTLVNLPSTSSIKLEPVSTAVSLPSTSSAQLESDKSLKLKFESDEFEELMEKKTFSDVIFKLGDKEIFSHKIIVANKSPVLAEMFENSIEENDGRFVIITDVEYNIFKELLRFIYTGKVNEIGKIVKDLIAAADKYGIENLKTECEIHLSKNINHSNVIECLDLVLHCNTSLLKRKVYDFILKNKKIIDKPEFTNLVKDKPDILLEILKATV